MFTSFPALEELKSGIRKEVQEEIAPYLDHLKRVESKIDTLIRILEPISKAVSKVPFLR